MRLQLWDYQQLPIELTWAVAAGDSWGQKAFVHLVNAPVTTGVIGSSSMLLAAEAGGLHVVNGMVDVTVLEVRTPFLVRTQNVHTIFDRNFFIKQVFVLEKYGLVLLRAFE